jgi:hypothetical protein
LQSEEAISPIPEKPRGRRLRLGRVPDPAKAHGAWVYLVLSVLAGTLAAPDRGFLPALLVGIGFAGIFLCASALALVGKRGMAPRLGAGVFLAVGGPGAALYLGASPSFFAFSLVALGPAALSGYFAEKYGFTSEEAVSSAVVALVVAAPSSACAGGASIGAGILLLALLAPFFAYRTWKVRQVITNEKGWTKSKLKKQGWTEALYGIGWTLAVVFAIHLYSLFYPH